MPIMSRDGDGDAKKVMLVGGEYECTRMDECWMDKCKNMREVSRYSNCDAGYM